MLLHMYVSTIRNAWLLIINNLLYTVDSLQIENQHQ